MRLAVLSRNPRLHSIRRLLEESSKLGIPLDLPLVEEVHPDRGGHKAGQDAEKEAMIDPSHGMVSSRGWTIGITGTRGRRTLPAAASCAIGSSILSTRRAEFPLCLVRSPTAVSTRRRRCPPAGSPSLSVPGGTPVRRLCRSRSR